MKAKILIIDDEVDYSTLLSRRLRLDGYDVACYDRGEGALETIRRILPDLILLDINLPNISGFEVYNRIKSDEELKGIPIIFLSALHEKEEYCLHFLKADGFLKKPCDSSLILRTITFVLAPLR